MNLFFAVFITLIAFGATAAQVDALPGFSASKKPETLEPQPDLPPQAAYQNNTSRKSQLASVSLEGEKAVPQGNNWSTALAPYIPDQPKSIRIIPNTEINPVLLPDDGSEACAYLKCQRSIVALIDWSDFAFNYQTGCAKFVSLGGHADLGANSVYEFCVGSLTWSRLYDYSQPQAPFPNLVDKDGDGRPECALLEDGPFGAHVYDGEEYISSTQQTIMLRTRGYNPKWQKCEMPSESNVWAWHDKGYYVELNLASLNFPRAAYDAKRDKLYVVAQGPDTFWEIDPHTLEMTPLDTVWAGKGGVMVMDDKRDIYFTSHNGGLYQTHMSVNGKLGPIRELIGYSAWQNKGWGFDISKGVVVGWDGSNNIIHYDTHTGKLEKIVAKGDKLPVTAGVKRVFGKFTAIPDLPGVFIGIADNYGWIIYRAF